MDRKPLFNYKNDKMALSTLRDNIVHNKCHFKIITNVLRLITLETFITLIDVAQVSSCHFCYHKED
jgi:hypothetical protein